MSLALMMLVQLLLTAGVLALLLVSGALTLAMLSRLHRI